MKKQSPNRNKKSTGTSSKPLPGSGTEKDADDLVHSQKEKETTELGEGDPDDMVHRSYRSGTDSTKENNLQDPDDRSHEYLEKKE